MVQFFFQELIIKISHAHFQYLVLMSQLNKFMIVNISENTFMFKVNNKPVMNKQHPKLTRQPVVRKERNTLSFLYLNKNHTALRSSFTT